MAQSSITNTSMRLSRVSKLRRLPSARAMARSRNSAAARVYSAECPSRQAFYASAQATKLLPTPVGPSTKMFS